MTEYDPRRAPPRLWRHDEGAMAAGVCAGLAEDLDLPLPLVRLVALVFLILPTGLAYLALGLLLRRRSDAGFGPARPFQARQRFAGRRAFDQETARPAMPANQDWALLRHRLAALEPRLGRIESFVTSNDFELHRGFRRMGE